MVDLHSQKNKQSGRREKEGDYIQNIGPLF